MSNLYDNIADVREEFRRKKERAEHEAALRRGEVELRFPEIAEIDGILARSGIRIMSAAKMCLGEHPDSAEAATAYEIAKIRAENDTLRERRAAILEENGYPCDYTSVKYECDKCCDSGYVGIDMCACMKAGIARARLAASGIGKQFGNQTFDGFSLDYYQGSDRDTARRNLDIIKDYAEHFDGSGESLLLIGGTGLGKTHLSSALAKVVISRGYDVVYDTVQGVISAFERQRFGSGSGDDGTTDKYFGSDLLIIDDLGTEISNQFTVACLYNIINTRINACRATVINTNLDQNELRGRYADRITSRLFGYFRPLIFTGCDVRLQKLKRNTRPF